MCRSSEPPSSFRSVVLALPEKKGSSHPQGIVSRGPDRGNPFGTTLQLTKKATSPVQAAQATTIAAGPSSWGLANRHLASGFLDGVHPWGVARGTYIVVPSLSLGNDELLNEAGSDPVAEQRLLALTLLLRSPDVRVVYTSSYEVPRRVLDGLLRFVDNKDDAESRLTTVRTTRGGLLSSALLDDPSALRRLQEAVAVGSPACLLSFDVTQHEVALAARLGIPVLGGHPEHQALCTKSGARKLALEIGVPVPEGYEDLTSLDEVEAAVEGSGKRSARTMVKLNDGFGGLGNVIVDSSAAGIPLTQRRARFGDPHDNWSTFGAKFGKSGGVVEAMVGDGALASPSAQLFITPDGETSVVSTQDQIMGGPTGQTCIGCAGPASIRYRHTITRHAVTIGEALREKGVWGFVGVDFLAEPAQWGSRVYLGEINLRMGATTPPNLYLRMLLSESPAAEGGDEDFLPSYVARQVRVSPDGCPAAGRPAFDPETAYGVVPYCVDPHDPSAGWLLAVAGTRKEALRVLERPEVALRGRFQGA